VPIQIGHFLYVDLPIRRGERGAHHQHLPGVEVRGRIGEIGHAGRVGDECGDDDIHTAHRQCIVEAIVGKVGNELDLDAQSSA